MGMGLESARAAREHALETPNRNAGKESSKAYEKNHLEFSPGPLPGRSGTGSGANALDARWPCSAPETPGEKAEEAASSPQTGQASPVQTSQVTATAQSNQASHPLQTPLNRAVPGTAAPTAR